MIRHIVLLKVRPEVTDAEISAIFADLAAIRDKLHGFTVDFTDWAALQAYQDHPDHKRVGAALVAAAIGGIDGILVFDLPC
jgi:hypothetical protein